MTGTSRVQFGENQVTSGTTVTVTLGSPTTAGNLLVVQFITESGQTGTSVTLTGGSDVFTKDAEITATNPTVIQIDQTLWSAPNISGGHTAVVGHASASATLLMMVWEVSGAALTSPLAGTPGAAGNPAATAQAAFDSTAAASAPAGSFWVAALQSVGSGGRSTITPAGLWTPETTLVPGSVTTMLGAYQANAGAGAPDFAGAFSVHNSYWTAVAAAYKPAASAAPSGLLMAGII